MFPLFRAVLKFCSTNRLFTYRNFFKIIVFRFGCSLFAHFARICQFSNKSICTNIRPADICAAANVYIYKNVITYDLNETNQRYRLRLHFGFGDEFGTFQSSKYPTTAVTNVNRSLRTAEISLRNDTDIVFFKTYITNLQRYIQGLSQAPSIL